MPAGRLSYFALAFIGIALLIAFLTPAIDSVADGLPKGLPAWFRTLDTDADGQISLREWHQAGKDAAEFQTLDQDDDGLVTPEEILRAANEQAFLKLKHGRLEVDAEVFEPTGEKYREKKSYRTFTIDLAEGQTYQIEHVSQAFYAYLYLEDADGTIVGKHNSGGKGRAARVVHRASRTGRYRIIATSQDGYKTGAFTLSIRVLRGTDPTPPPPELPPFLKKLDADHDGQIALHEWRRSGKKPAEFRKYDRDNDGFITPRDVSPPRRGPIALKFKNGRAVYKGSIESTDTRYLDKKIARFFTVRLLAGRTYRIDLMSRAFDAYLYLEDGDGTVLAQNDDGGQGTDSRIVHKAEGGTYRLVATSLDGSRVGAISIAVLDLDGDAALAEELPTWFRALDTNNDGQVDLDEWYRAGKKPAAFHEYDRDDDGCIMPQELLRTRKPLTLQLQRGEATFAGVIEPTDPKYKGKKIAKTFTVSLRAGATYQFDHMSKAFDAYLYLESPEGKVVAQNDDGGKGTDSRIVHRAADDGAYRLIATSLPGTRSGAFTISIHVVKDSSGSVVPELPKWFHTLDTDADGQIALHEWRVGGLSLADFRKIDRDDDGFLTPDEVLRYLKSHPDAAKK